MLGWKNQESQYSTLLSYARRSLHREHSTHLAGGLFIPDLAPDAQSNADSWFARPLLDPRVVHEQTLRLIECPHCGCPEYPDEKIVHPHPADPARADLIRVPLPWDFPGVVFQDQDACWIYCGTLEHCLALKD